VQATKQQQIMGYFIEEAKEHLDTIEQGLLDLQATMADSERLNELFRAAHSVKGGAAMLGLNSIQKVSHHLEDSFKLLKEHSVKIDQQLENLFFQGFDTLKDLVEALQSPYGLREDEGEQIVQTAEPTFVELQNYLNRLLQGGSKPQAGVTPAPAQAKPGVNLSATLAQALKMMLQLFKQGDSAACRQQLTKLCDKMVQLHTSPEWKGLLQTAQGAIANPKTSFQTLAPILIKELKQAGDLLVTGRASEITSSRNLQQLAQPVAIATPAAPAVASRETARPKQITIPSEPRAAARALLEAFRKDELIELAEFLMKAIQ
jgi:chemotaxis protein histidine kinase CheA